MRRAFLHSLHVYHWNWKRERAHHDDETIMLATASMHPPDISFKVQKHVFLKRASQTKQQHSRGTPVHATKQQ